MYMGEYNHTVDTKGRLIIPSKFRETLGDTFVVTRGMEYCLFVYDNADWNIMAEKLMKLPTTDKNARFFIRAFLSGAAAVEVDKQGRILLPAKLRQYASLEKDVTLIGAGNHVEIWSTDKWEEAMADVRMEDLAADGAEWGI